MDHYVAREDINPAIVQLLVALSSVPLFKWAGRAIAEPSHAAAETASPPALSQQHRSGLLSASRLRSLAQATATRLRSLAQAVATRLRHRTRSVGKALVNDWRTHKYTLYAVLLVCITTMVVVAYYLNHPQPELTPDTRSYLDVAQRIQMRGRLVDPFRLPGYPLLIVLVYTLAGQGNLAAVSVVQAVLFVLATLELYVLAVLVLRRGWVALLIGLLVGTNLTLLSYVKPLMSEALALWLLVSLALAVALFVYTRRVRFLWLMTVIILVLFLTRPEWIYLPLPLFAYLLLVAWKYGVVRRVLPHALASVILLYAVLGNYIYINAFTNGFVGVTSAQNLLAFGKVLQYDMQDEAPPQYEATRQLVDSYVARGIKDPYYILAHESALSRDYDALAGAYAQAIIVGHPGEFLVKSVPLAFSSLTNFSYGSRAAPTGPFSMPLLWLQSVFRSLYDWNRYFPLCAVLWLLLLCWRRTRQLRAVQLMGAVVLLALYGLVLSTLGGFDGYERHHIPFMPLLILVFWGSLLSAALLLAQKGPSLLAWLTSHYFRRQQVSISTATILIASLGGVGLLLFVVRLLLTHGSSSQVGVVFFFVLSVVSIFRYFRPSEQK